MKEREKRESQLLPTFQNEGTEEYAGRMEKGQELSQENKGDINSICVCVCTDGKIELFQKRRIFDIQYSAWVDVYYGIDSKGNFTNRIAIWGKTGDKVFPKDKWLQKGEFIITKQKQIIEVNCSIGKVVKGQEILHMMRKNTGGMYCKTGTMTTSDMAQILKSADRYLRWEKPESPKQKIKNRKENY